MRGVIYIERENTDGDRRIVNNIDVEGLPQGSDVMFFVRAAARDALREPATYCVRAIHEDTMRMLYTEHV